MRPTAPVKGFPGYEVSDDGVVYSTMKGPTPNPLKPMRAQSGHLKVRLMKGSRRVDKYVHRLVAEAFLPNPQKATIVRHLNGNPEDNRVGNLAWGTPEENAQDRVAHKTATEVLGDSFVRKARVVRVVDGDTVIMDLDLGFRTWGRHSLRLAGIDTPEIFRADEEERERGRRAKELVENWLFSHGHSSPRHYWVQTDKDRRSFNRYIALDVQCSQGHSLVGYLRGLGYGA